jgi:engulfment/cell motility protein 1
MDNHQSDEISPLILQFQSNLVALAHTQLKTAVDINSPKHTRLLEEIWRHAKLPSSARQDGMKWQAIGFSSESPEREFDRVGMLGLRSMHRFAMTELQEYPKVGGLSWIPFLFGYGLN